jgi:hypothetical protein
VGADQAPPRQRERSKTPFQEVPKALFPRKGALRLMPGKERDWGRFRKTAPFDRRACQEKAPLRQTAPDPADREKSQECALPLQDPKEEPFVLFLQRPTQETPTQESTPCPLFANILQRSFSSSSLRPFRKCIFTVFMITNLRRFVKFFEKSPCIFALPFAGFFLIFRHFSKLFLYRSLFFDLFRSIFNRVLYNLTKSIF